jgi:hypothetical protein
MARVAGITIEKDTLGNARYEIIYIESVWEHYK